MKNISLLLLFIGSLGIAQVKGNKKIETKSFPFENVETIKIDLHADITIDMAQEESLSITTDGNLLEFIDTEIVDGTIHFSQLKWIESSKGITIKIGAPNLKRVVHDAHDTTKIINVSNNELRVNANIGNVIIEGKTDELRLGVANGKIDASKIEAKSVYVNLWNWGTITVNPVDYLWADVSNDGKLYYTNLPKENKIKTKSGGMAASLEDKNNPSKKSIKWISFKIRNNSGKRNQFAVKGPKADGGYFGYGFPMSANTKRKEKWSVGTKIYKVNKLGLKKLLVTITAEDEGKVVNLFD